MQRALILAPGDRIEADHLLLGPEGCAAEQAQIACADPEPVRVPGQATSMRDLERQHILETLAAVGGSRKLAVQRLGISERTLRYKLQQYRTDGVI